ncbi:MAG: sigma-54-dependent Fis family transcriptional regulator [Ignavibacteriales bacterium CG_4_9_14_3_um_filter_34_10]|nr:MAG: sigma-54-dependent Fis family transcriptional regulator [Ignavibacteriales bacterium CG_4_9_14_3_um_filter_34_10]
MITEKKIKILLIEDEDFDVNRVKNTIRLFGDQLELIDVVSNGADAIEIIRAKDNFDIIIMDYQIAGGLRGEELIRKIKDVDDTIQIIVITKLTINISDFNFAKSLVKAGAFWYCTKYPGDIEEYIYQPTDFLMSILNAYEKRKLELHRRNSNLKLIKNVEDILFSKRIISASESMEKLKNDIQRYAESEINILISGASGTGKELVANNIHYRSKRKFENFVPINCGSIPADLIESELFGYEKGAFTGANVAKLGLFELANNGTLFLDEVAELPLNAQVKLLRVIQDGEIEKIGRTKRIKVNVRIFAATNKDLEKEVEEKRFREDLYYRLNVVPVYIKPLKERVDDIEVLVKHFIEVYSFDMGKVIPTIDKEVLDELNSYNWPGNVRELKNVVQRLIFNCGNHISKEDLDFALIRRGRNQIKDSNAVYFADPMNIEPLKTVEKKIREKYFRYVRNHSASDAEAAAKLGLAPPNYHRMCRELGLK